ncbi:hypothetical protein D1872_235070 [compost metagenome]
MFRFLFIQAKNGYSDKSGENNDGQRRRAARARHVGKRIRRDEIEHLLRNRLVGHLANALLQFRPPRLFRFARLNFDRLQVEAKAGDNADRRRNRGRNQQDGDDQRAHLPEILLAFQLGNRRDDRDHDQRNDHHLQQADIPASDQIEPVRRFSEHFGVARVKQLKDDAEYEPQAEAGKYPFRKRDMLLLHPNENAEQYEHDCDVDNDLQSFHRSIPPISL